MHVPILMYHYFYTHHPAPEWGRYATSGALFQEHLQGLQTSGYRAISLEEYYRNDNLPPKPIIITIDDGHASGFDIAYPLLKEHNCTATFFIPADWVGTPGFLTGDQIATLSRTGMEIGSHGTSHESLHALATEELHAELANSRSRLQEITRLPVDHLSVPNGLYSPQLLQMATATGYHTVSVSRFGVNNSGGDCGILRRISVEKDMNWLRMQSLLTPTSLRYQYSRLYSFLWYLRKNMR